MTGTGGQLNRADHVPGRCLCAYGNGPQESQGYQQAEGQGLVSNVKEAGCGYCAHGNTILGIMIHKKQVADKHMRAGPGST